GTLSTDALPDLSDWQIGVGIGARYYSSFGPIRIDLGTPLNPRPGDGSVAVVVSLGQAF
ncbi:MAG TPA: BamA/TamA family outer membrane protein, partial [Sphingomicrobium sp.]|nr:BamA/TamA family outer membrane protein [Sphingomicrobium sp.]